MDINELNDMQQEAVRHTDGPLLVIAGAGSGKTRVLTYRIAYLIEECNVDPYNILAITFTNKAAGEMKERVSAITPAGSQVWVSTFHSMCVRILRRFADSVGFTRDFAIYDPDDCKSVMKELFKKNNINTQYYKEKSVLAAISSAKDEMKTPADLLRDAESDFKLKTIADLYGQYQAELKNNNAMDFDDLIFKTVELLTTDSLVHETYADRFRYIMVDEYQDTNTSQFRLVSLLADKWRNLCVVGDDDQSIYKFRGANIENILSFERVFSGARVVKLEQNYRSTSVILNAANSVIRHNGQRKEKALWTGNEEGEKVSLLMYDNAYQEGEGIAGRIGALLRDGFSCNDIAILYRTNAQSRILEEKLLIANVPYRIYGGINFYQRREIKDILSYLKVLVNPSDSQALKRIINVPKRAIGPTTVERVQRYADDQGITFWEALCAAENVPEIGNAHKKTAAFVEMIGSFRAAAEEMSLEELTQHIIDTIDYTEYISAGLSSDEIAEKQENIDELFSKIVDFEASYVPDEENSEDEGELREAGGLEILHAFLEEVSLIADNESGNAVKESVSLMTLHSAKGLEFPVVFMSGMEDGLFPSYMAISIMDEDRSEIEEERRLCYVGITRAQKKLFLTFARERMVRGDRHTSTVSRFIKEIDEKLLEKVNNSLMGDDFGFSGGSGSPERSQDESEAMQAKPRKLSRFTPKNKAKFDFFSMGGTKPAARATEPKPVTFGKSIPAGTAPDKLRDEIKANVDTKESVSQTGSYTKPASSEFCVGDRVNNERFGDGVVKDIEDKGRDRLLTVEFDEIGVKKMFEGFINLKKI